MLSGFEIRSGSLDLRYCQRFSFGLTIEARQPPTQQKRPKFYQLRFKCQVKYVLQNCYVCSVTESGMGLEIILAEIFTDVLCSIHSGFCEIADPRRKGILLHRLNPHLHRHFEFEIKNRKLKAHSISHVRDRRIKRIELDAFVKKL